MACNTFELQPVPPFRLDLTVWTLRRRPHNIVDRWDGRTYRRVLTLPIGSTEVAVTQLGSPELPRLHVAAEGQLNGAALRADATAALERLLGLRTDLTGFYQFAAPVRRLGPLAQRFRGMKPPRFATVFEGVVNAMACQLVTLTLGVHLLNRLAVAYGTSIGEGGEAVHAFPRPEELARLTPPAFRQLGFSHQKGRAIIELAQSVAEGRLDLEGFADLPDDEAATRLCELRGVGRWTAEYALLRGLGRTHVFPGDDVGARNNLQHWLQLAEPLDYAGVRKVLSRWEGYAGLVYFHLLLDRLAEAGHLGEPSPEARGNSTPRGLDAFDTSS